MSDLTDRTDEDLGPMHRAGRGDTEAFAAIYERYFPVVFDFLCSRNGRGASAEDLAQEAFLRSWRDAWKFEGRSSVKTFLVGIAQNVYREELAQAARRERLNASLAGQNDGLATADPRIESEDELLPASLARSIRSISPQARHAIELVVKRGWNVTEAAACSGCSTGTFRRRLNRAIASLRAKLTG